MIKIAVVDDENAILKQIIQAIEVEFNKRNINTTISGFSTGVQLLKSIKEGRNYNAVFLDIEMPNKTGLETAKEIRSSNPNTIIAFITSFDNYVYDAFDYDAAGYIRKQEIDIRLSHVIDRILQKYIDTTNEKIFKNINGQYKTTVQNIVFFESYDHNIIIHNNDGVVFSTTDSLKHLEEEYSALGFYRIYSGYLVNMAYIFSIEKNSIMIKYASHTQTLPVSRSRVKELKIAYQRYIRGIR